MSDLPEPPASKPVASTPPLPRRDRVAILAGLVGVSLLAWLYLIDMAWDMRSMDMDAMSKGAADLGAAASGAMPGMDMGAANLGAAADVGASMLGMRAWSPNHFAMMFAMWAVMMVGMMVPTAIPMTLVYAAVARKAAGQGQVLAPTAVFVGGYVAMWTLFSLGATVAQWGLDRAALLSPMLVATSPLLGAGLLMAAGVYQLTPLKNACLEHCRSPAHFLSQNWRAGTAGAFRLGVVHGAYCLGCCWILMGLLFFGGVMSLLWIAGITAFVLLEKVLPQGVGGGRAAGVAMIAAGALVLALGS